MGRAEADEVSFNLPFLELTVARRLEHDRYAVTSASRTHEPRLQAREGEVRSSRANQSVEVELLPIDASPDRLRALAITIGAPHVHLPTKASRDTQCLDFHENEIGTDAASRQAVALVLSPSRSLRLRFTDALRHDKGRVEGLMVDAFGADTIAWLEWLAGLPGGMAAKAENMEASAWAAWVQAIGSILAIVAGFGTVVYQNRHSDKAQESDRKSRAEIVALRLSVWLGEIGGRIDNSLLRLQKSLNTERMLPNVVLIGPELKLNVVGRIDDVMSDLHYLRAGSGDIALLAYFANFFDAFINNQITATMQRLGDGKSDYSELKEFYSSVANQLNNMKNLHTNATRHLSPLIDTAIQKER